MKTYPIMLDLTGRKCVVVGGGPIGLRKAAGLASAGAGVLLVDPDAVEGADDGIERLRAEYDPAQLAGARLVLACTDDAGLNARIADDARRAGALANAVDQPGDCDFFVPAVAGDGDVIVAVGTGGSAPALARRLKDRLARQLPDRIGEFAAALAEARGRIRADVADPDRRARVLKKLAGDDGYDAFIRGGLDALMALAEETE